MTTSQIDAENTQMTNDLYRLLKKYSGLRNLIRQLKVTKKKTFSTQHILLKHITFPTYQTPCLQCKNVFSICHEF